MFTFTGKDVQVVEAWNDFQKETVPSGCTVTSAYVENRSHRSAVKNAVFYDQPVVRAITNTTAKAADTRQDEDPKGGQFKVSDLTNGTYTLKEINAPERFRRQQGEDLHHRYQEWAGHELRSSRKGREPASYRQGDLAEDRRFE